MQINFKIHKNTPCPIIFVLKFSFQETATLYLIPHKIPRRKQNLTSLNNSPFSKSNKSSIYPNYARDKNKSSFQKCIPIFQITRTYKILKSKIGIRTCYISCKNIFSEREISFSVVKFFAGGRGPDPPPPLKSYSR